MIHAPAYPDENQKQFVDSLHLSAGGPAANAACLLARWGVDTQLMAQLGTDHFSEIILADLQAAGVETGSIQRYDGPCNCAVVISSNQSGSRTVLSRNFSNSVPPGPLPPAGDADAILVDGHQYVWSLELLRRHRGISVLDAGSFRHETASLLTEVSDPVTSAPFYHSLKEQASEDMPHPLTIPDFMVVTDGENPVIVRGKGLERAIPVFDVAATDTLAAGDCFHGAYLFGRLLDLTVEECVTLAAAAAAVCVTRTGGNKSLPSLQETVLFLETSRTVEFAAMQSQKLVDKIWSTIMKW